MIIAPAKILIADDNEAALLLGVKLLKSWSFEVTSVNNGQDAWKIIQTETEPLVAVLDWNMPIMSGVDICRMLKQVPPKNMPHILLLTANDKPENIVEGLEAGADDYLVKPYNHAEFRARVNVGVKLVALRHQLADRIAALEGALANIKHLQGLLPMCAWCRKIRKDKDYWQALETYVTDNTEAKFTHGICPECAQKVLSDMKAKAQKNADPA